MGRFAWPMGGFAWRNLRTRPLRTVLALVGLSVPILGVLGLFSLSQGLRNMVGDTLSRVEGVMLVRENAPSPVFSELPSDLAETLRKIPGVRVVAPEVWKIALNVEGMGLSNALASKRGLLSAAFDQPVIQGEDIATHAELKSAVFPKNMKEGRFLNLGDRDQRRIVISRKIARDHPGSDGKPRKVGDTLRIGGKPFEIIGIYETGSMLLDVVIVMDINTGTQADGDLAGERSRATTSRPATRPRTTRSPPRSRSGCRMSTPGACTSSPATSAP